MRAEQDVAGLPPSTRYGDIRVLLVTTDLACGIPDFASLNPGYLLRRAQPVAFLIAVSKLFGSKAVLLWIRPRRWVGYQTENVSIASGFGASARSTTSSWPC